MTLALRDGGAGVRMILALALALAALAVAPAGAAAAAPCPAVTAPATIVVEATSGLVVCERNADRQRPIASATKLMTALLVLDGTQLSRVIAGADYRAAPVESKIDLRPGERMTVADLLRGLLLESANDAAEALAEGVAGSRATFVRAMNARARRLGLSGTHFANPIGLDAPGNHSSARGLARLTLELRRYPFFRATVDRPAATLRSGDRVRIVRNRNDLVREVPWVDGVKTGHTSRAGYVLVASAKRPKGPNAVRLVSVALGSASEAARSQDSLTLLRFGFSRLRVVRPVRRGVEFAQVPIAYRRGATLPVVAAQTFKRTVLRADAGAFDTRAIGLPDEVEGPVARGARLGTLEVRRRGRVIGRVALVAEASVPAAGLSQRIKHGFTRPLTFVLLLAAAGGTVLVGRLVRRRESGARGRSRRSDVEAAA